MVLVGSFSADVDDAADEPTSCLLGDRGDVDGLGTRFVADV